MARLPLVPPDSDDPIVEQVFEKFALEQRPPIALYRALAHAPKLLRAYSVLAAGLRNDAATDRGLRELVILRTAQLADSGYEWAHHVPMAAAAGVRDEQIRTLRHWAESDAFSMREKIVLECVDQIEGHAVSDTAFAALEDELGRAEAVEIVLLASFYQAVARMIQALGLEIESEYVEHLASW